MPARINNYRVPLTPEIQNSLSRSLTQLQEIRQDKEKEDAANNTNDQRAVFNSYPWSASTQVENGWLQAVTEIITSMKSGNQDFLSTTKEACIVALRVLSSVQKARRLAAPEITPDGDGNLYLEWKAGDRLLSICICNNPEGSYIYSGEGDDYKPYPLNEHNQKEAIDRFLA